MPHLAAPTVRQATAPDPLDRTREDTWLGQNAAMDKASSVVELSLEGYSGHANRVTVTVSSYDRATRLRRALVGLTVGWALALVSLAVPLAHFLLVPGFLVLGMVLFTHRIRLRRTAAGAHGTCPDCGEEQEFDLPARWRLPARTACSRCQRVLELRETKPPLQSHADPKGGAPRHS